jgi:hypothetical protein
LLIGDYTPGPSRSDCRKAAADSRMAAKRAKTSLVTKPAASSAGNEGAIEQLIASRARDIKMREIELVQGRLELAQQASSNEFFKMQQKLDGKRLELKAAMIVAREFAPGKRDAPEWEKVWTLQHEISVLESQLDNFSKREEEKLTTRGAKLDELMFSFSESSFALDPNALAILSSNSMDTDDDLECDNDADTTP